MKIILTIITVFFALQLPVAAQPVPVVIDDTYTLILAGKKISYAEDGKRKITLSSAKKNYHKWNSSDKDILNFSFTDAPYWLHLKIDNRIPEPSPRILRLAYPLIDSIEVFYTDRDKKERRLTGGDRLPFHQRIYNDRNFVFPLYLGKGVHDIFMRVESSSSMRLPLEIMTIEAFLEENSRKTALLWIFYGLMIFILIHNLFLFFTVKETMYGSFALFILSWVLYEACHNGIGYQFLWPSSPWLQGHLLPFSIALSVIFVSFFFLNYLEVKARYKILYRIIIFALVVPAVAIIPLSLIASYSISIKAILALGMIASPLLFILTVRAVANGDRRAVYLLAGFVVMLVGQLLSNLLSWGLVPFNTITNSSVQIGSAVIVIVFSLGMSDNLNFIRKKLEKSEQSLTKNNQELAETNEQLQAALEELEAANEEFEAQNEELVASQYELERNEAQLRIMLRWLPIPVAIDNSGAITLANQAFNDLLGYGEDNFTSTEQFMVHLFPDELHRKQILRYYFEKKKSAEDGDIIEIGQHHVTTRGGDLLIMDIRVTIAEPLLLVVLHDITEQQKSREMMIETEKMMALGGLAAGMAHEINNPLGVIVQGVQTTLSRLDPKNKKNQSRAEELGIDLEAVKQYLESRHILEYLNGISEAGSRAASIVKNMLSFSRKSSTSQSSEDLNTLIDSTIEIASSDYDLKKGYDFKKTRIYRDYQSELPPVTCVKGEIQQVILNLIRNASQAMRSDERKSMTPELFITTSSDKRGVTVTIRDTGPGISQNELSRIFEPFFTTKDSDEGTGLGLSVSHFIITERHSGTIAVSSKVGKGTTFTIFIPFQ